MKKEKNPNLENISNNLQAVDILPNYITDLIEEELSNNPVSEDGTIFLDDKLSAEINKKLDNTPSLTYFSKVLDKTILLVGYYAPNFVEIKNKNKFLSNVTLNERKEMIQHVYFELPLSENKLDKKEFQEMQESSNNALSAKEIYAKSINKLEQILDRKSMNKEGYIFLNENERDELGEDFLLNTRKLHLEEYANMINIACVKPDIEIEMEKRYAEYSFDALNKFKHLNTVIYPLFPNQKVKGREYKAGLQKTDKKQMPMIFWMLICSVCFAASICIIIWTFGFVVPTTATTGIFYNPNPPVDGALVIQSLFPNAWTFLSHIAASITTFLFVFLFGWRPMKQMLEKRHQYIANQISSAEKLNKEADIKLEYATRQELLAYAKSNEVFENAIRDINLKKEAAEKEIKLEAAQIRQNAMNDAIKIHENLKTQINDEIVNNSLQIASELLKRNISNDDNQQFVNDFIRNLESNKQDD